MMQKVVFKPNIKKVAIFYQEDAYGKDEGDLAEAAIKQHGGIDIVSMVSCPMNATDLTAQATRIRNVNPDIGLMLTSAPAMGGAFVCGAELGKILAQGGKQPAGYAEILGSTAIVALAEALRRIDGPVTGPKTRDALEHICGFSGTYADGTFCYTKDQHDGSGPGTVNFVKLHNGKWKNVKF
jgi:branched-chain amino acid transport system substrate-binding protein